MSSCLLPQERPDRDILCPPLLMGPQAGQQAQGIAQSNVIFDAGSRREMWLAVKAGSVYFALVFLAGFALGTVRVLILVPRLGTLRAVVLETPVILTASWIFCGWALRRFAVPACAKSRLAMGGVAFVLLMSAEALLSVAMGDSLAAYFASLGTPEGALGLSGQSVFALLPWVHMWTGRPERD